MINGEHKLKIGGLEVCPRPGWAYTSVASKVDKYELPQMHIFVQNYFIKNKVDWHE